MKTLVRFLKPHKGLVALTLLILLIDNAGTLLVPTMLANMVNVGITSGSTEYILRNGLLMLGATAMASGGAVTGSYLTARLASRVACDIRCAIYRKSLEFSASDFERFGTGAMITRTLGDINVIQQAIIMTCQMVLPMPVLAVVGIILAFRIDYQMGLMLLIAVAIVMVLAVITVAKTAPIFIRLQSFVDRMNVVLRENIVGARVIRAFGREQREEQREGRVFEDYAQNAIRVNYVFSGLDCSCFFVMNMVEVCVIWLGGNRVGAHAMQIASISAVLEYAILILFFIMMAQMVMVTMPRAKACLDRAREVLELEPSIVDSADAKVPLAVAAPARALAGERDVVARFDHASFRFADADEDTLHDLTFSCRRGQTTAIIGSTGSGKSTVAKLLLRLHDITRGRVLLGERDVRDITQRELRARVSYVPQKAWLFSGTVASNLRDGLPDATEEQMRHALDVAQSQFVYDLERGLDAAVAQGGTNFSGGQRQRLAIARAIIKPADLYIFDDSFSALDFKTDAALRAALTQEMRGSALLIIAQRISTILHADQIIVLKDGEVVGQGHHEELMETCEAYRAIAESQMRGGEAHE
ncbi:ABC transporter ATP-binding protein [Collinsella sp. KGMB02528]|uniref:ABC transporter ATP-binding protein n=1 Tax=Collinsella acetigenes TaxID=2713419 RepID=A0A7X9UDB3_9ACTN|nr:ABC transporter ATP-binding protein [Collinsella acetigenes]NMF56381.1 ABC transporter ATP-binding protein [Collinsella acetigenes]